MQTPTDEQLADFSRRLERMFGNTVQALILHGSLVETPAQENDRRDADLLVIIADLALEQARPLVDRVRWSAPFRHLNLAHNTVGYQQVCEHLAEGHPFFVSAIRSGRYLRYRQGVKDDLQAQVQTIDADRLRQGLARYAQIEQQRVNHALREVFRGLINLAYDHLQMDWLQRHAQGEVLSPSSQQTLADWRALLEDYGGDEEAKALLQRLFQAKIELSRGGVPELCQECFTLMARLHPTSAAGGDSAS